MFVPFAIFQGDNAYDAGKAIGYLLSSVICVVVVVVLPLVFLARSRRQKIVRADMFLIFKNGQQCGPYSIEQIRSYLASGQFELSDLAWYQNAWVRMSSIPMIVGS